MPAHLVQGPTQSSLLSLSKGICDSCTILPPPALVRVFETLYPNSIGTSLSECPVQTCHRSGSLGLQMCRSRCPAIMLTKQLLLKQPLTTDCNVPGKRCRAKHESSSLTVDCSLVRLTLLMLFHWHANVRKCRSQQRPGMNDEILALWAFYICKYLELRA